MLKWGKVELPSSTWNQQTDVLHGIDMKTKKKKKRIKSRRGIKAGEHRKTDVPFGRVSVQETLNMHSNTGHIISSFTCGSHINILVNSVAKHLAFWQKTIHLHLSLSTMPWTGKRHWHLMWNVCKKGLVDLRHTCAVPRLTTMEMNARHTSTPEEESFTMQNEGDVSRLQTYPPTFAISSCNSKVPLKTAMDNFFPNVVVVELTHQKCTMWLQFRSQLSDNTQESSTTIIPPIMLSKQLTTKLRKLLFTYFLPRKVRFLHP